MSEIATSRLRTIELFCKAAEALSFTAAAELAGATPSAVSKAVSRLESQLGVKLFQRTTRAIRLTDEGAGYYETCRQALSSIQQAEQALTKGRTRPHGTLRLSLPASYGILNIVPRIPRYLERYAHEVKVVVSLSNSITEFVTQGCDMAIRIGAVADSRVVARPLRDAHYCVVASPAYLRRHGVPREPDDMRNHQCIDLVLPDIAKPLPWQFRDGKREWELAVPSALSVDHPLAAMTAALADGGCARLLDFTVADGLQAGRLVEVLASYRSAPVPMSIVYPSNRHLSAKVRTFIDFLVEDGGHPSG